VLVAFRMLVISSAVLLLALSVFTPSALRQDIVGEPACKLPIVMKFEGKRVNRLGCQGAGSSLPHGGVLKCKAGFLMTKVYCCGGQLGSKKCPGVSYDATTTAGPQYSAATKKCAITDASSWTETTPGPIMSGKGKTVSTDFVKNMPAASDEACRAKCCEEKDCYGIVRHATNKHKCWLLLLPTTEVGDGKSADFRMIAKPEKLISQKYPYALPFIVPLGEADLISVYKALNAESEEYYKFSLYDRKTLQRSIIFNAPTLTAYIAIGAKPEKREEFRVYHGSVPSEGEHGLLASCSNLNKVSGGHVAECYGTQPGGTDGGVSMQQTEFVGTERLEFNSMRTTEEMQVIVRQMVHAHLEILDAGLMRRESRLSDFVLTRPAKESFGSLGLAETEVGVKLVTMRDAVEVAPGASAQDAALSAASSIVEMLGVPAKCAVEKKKGTAVSEDSFIQTLKDCAEESRLVKEFVSQKGPVALALLLGPDGKGAEDTPAALKSMLASEYLKDTPDLSPTDMRLQLARAFDACEALSAGKVTCLAGHASAADGFDNCKAQGPLVRKGIPLHAFTCSLG